MDVEMIANGRQLEQQVAGMMQLLDGIQDDLARVTGNPETELAARELARKRADMAATIGKLQGGQARLEQRLEEYVAELARREAALDASRTQMLALKRRLVHVQEEERRALARDLHDTSSQGMTVLGLGLAMLKRQCGCNDASRGRIEDLQRAAGEVSEELHRLSANLRPATLDRYGLVPAAEELVAALRDQAGVEVRFQAEGLEERLPEDVETALYRIIQEGCTNITRYAGAAHAEISLRRDDALVRVSIGDDGRGFDVDEALARNGLGLAGMRERAEVLGGKFTIDSRPGCGTRLVVEAPAVGACTGAPAEGSVRVRAVAPAQPPASTDAARLARAKALSDSLDDIIGGLSHLTDEHQQLAYVLARAATAVGCDYALIALREGRRWIVTHAYGLPESMIGQRLIPAAIPLALEIERTGGVVVVNNTQADDPLAEAARETGVFSGAGIPLIAAGRFLGAVAFAHNTDPVPFAPGEVAFLRHLGAVISLVLEIIQLRA